MTHTAPLTLTVHGARGSMCVSGVQYRRFGGNTTSMYVPLGPNEHFVIDAGTGLRTLERSLGPGPHHFTMLFTHYHWDHVQGLPVFAPLHDPANSFSFIGPPSGNRDIEATLCAVLCEPWFPVSLAAVGSDTRYVDVAPRLEVGPVVVRSIPLRHPQGVTAYRLDGPVRSITVATDHEAGDESADAALASLASGTHVLMHDGQYTDAEYRTARKGWGHSTPSGAVDAALACGAGRLVLTSHDPDHDDAAIDAIVTTARARFPLTTGAFEGMTLAL